VLVLLHHGGVLEASWTKTAHACHQHVRVHHQELLSVVTVLVGTVQSRARIAKLAHGVWVDEQTFLTVVTLWEEFARLARVMELALVALVLALGPVSAPDLFLVDRGR
jgi:hypothetical protein